jgi:DNA recombination protein RmuC
MGQGLHCGLSMSFTHPWLVIALACVNIAVLLALLWLVWAQARQNTPGAERQQSELAFQQTVQQQLQQLPQLQQVLAAAVAGLQAANERLERELRGEIQGSASAARQESAQGLATFQQTLLTQGAEATRTQNAQIDAFGQQLAAVQTSLLQTLNARLMDLSEANARRVAEVRDTLERQLAQLQASNTAKLDEMRQTVDEKLQHTLQARLGESFKQVAERLEQVHKGLGEMQTLAAGVGDLKHLLSNVKTRGMFGEAQLAGLLEQVFTTDQYAAQVPTRPGSREAVDFAIRMPGQGDGAAPLWLPIDAKFPNESYERLLQAQTDANADGIALEGRALERDVRTQAKSIADKYIEPPHTTDFAILFLPTEGLFAEVLRRPGLLESLRREQRVVLAGPTTLLAMLGSLQMGFRTLAMERRSHEVQAVLGAVKTEFAKFGDMLEKARNQTATVLKTLENSGARTRAMERALRQVEALPEDRAQALLPSDADSQDG